MFAGIFLLEEQACRLRSKRNIDANFMIWKFVFFAILCLNAMLFTPPCAPLKGLLGVGFSQHGRPKGAEC
ncbi:MAG: hypothetical protein ACE5I1_24895, partial [bacterium]